MTSICTPVRARMAATTSAPFVAILRPAVPTAAIARTPLRLASSTMPEIAATVRSSAASPITPVSASPSPRRVTSARSATVRHVPP